MKFCKNLQRVVDISDPEWAPYWTNYKMLKKLIKELPSLVPTDDGKHVQRPTAHARPDSPCSLDSSSTAPVSSSLRQQHGDMTAERASGKAALSNSELSQTGPPTSQPTNVSTTRNRLQQPQANGNTHIQQQGQQQQQEQSMAAPSPRRPQQQHLTASAAVIGKSPGEIAFFKLLHAEFRKAERFFDRAQQEFIIREERVREGMDIMKKPNSIMVNEKWSLLSKSIYRLYRDLLLLETFCIMTYCSFSKILKKHDKVTGYDTRNAFMANIVNKANFTNYPKVLEMINRCERLYEEVSQQLVREGKNGLYEDERLFINMIHRLNEQTLDTEDGKGPTGRKKKEKYNGSKIGSNISGSSPPTSYSVGPNKDAISSLRSLVEENDKIAAKTSSRVGEGCEDDSDEDNCHDMAARKRSSAVATTTTDDVANSQMIQMNPSGRIPMKSYDHDSSITTTTTKRQRT